VKRVFLIIIFFLSIFVLIGFNKNSIAITKSKEIVGEIVSVDTNKNQLILKTKKGDVIFDLNEKSKISIRKESKNLSDLKIGDKVKIYYIQMEGKNIVERIIIKSSIKK
jgi:Cu/Ag efflux protein CusF